MDIVEFNQIVVRTAPNSFSEGYFDEIVRYLDYLLKIAPSQEKKFEIISFLDDANIYQSKPNKRNFMLFVEPVKSFIIVAG